MEKIKNLEKRIFNINSEQEFNDTALEIFRLQASNNPVYREFISILRINPGDIRNYREIPFLPIEIFKTRKVIWKDADSQIIFSSSGTSGMQQSKHYVAKTALYETSFNKCFEMFYGNPKDHIFLALLPSYLEREGSSLIYMADHLIRESESEQSGFYLNELDELSELIKNLDKGDKKIILLGVTYALLDLIEKNSFNLKNTIIMETGGMKGRRKEILREELHNILCAGFGVDKIHSEYGMTELLSQAYSKGDGIFNPPPWMKILIRDINDPRAILENSRTGGINIIDLANIYSCSFLSVNDLGRQNGQYFEVLGRFDFSDLRGCNLLVN